ncbi:MAG: type II toxin-antitoxin system VapC family toxin [Candidatus Heimdallarchaeaceae archaeon]
MKILLDTSFLVELKKGSKKALNALIERKKKTQDILVSSLTIYELLFGTQYILKKHNDINELKQVQ